MKTTSPEETQALAAQCAAGLSPQEHATIVELVGDLGAGKTTFMQGIGAYFGLTKPLSSPTFVIGKMYDLHGKPWKRLIHIDAYRIDDPKELSALGWTRYAEDPGNLIFIEWPAKMQTDLRATKRITFEHISVYERDIKI